MRAFVALELEPESLGRAVRLAERLRACGEPPSATWTPPERMHVTLKFAGDLAPEAVEPLTHELASLVAHHRRPRPCPMHLDAFPALQHARIVILGLEDASSEIAGLATKMDDLFAEHQVTREERAFRPHVTLARLKRAFDARRWLRADLAMAAGDCVVSALTFFRSDLRATGPAYTPLATFALPPAPR